MLHWIAEYESKTKVPPAIDSPLLTVKRTTTKYPSHYRHQRNLCTHMKIPNVIFFPEVSTVKKMHLLFLTFRTGSSEHLSDIKVLLKQLTKVWRSRYTLKSWVVWNIFYQQKCLWSSSIKPHQYILRMTETRESPKISEVERDLSTSPSAMYCSNQSKTWYYPVLGALSSQFLNITKNRDTSLFWHVSNNTRQNFKHLFNNNSAYRLMSSANDWSGRISML